MYFTNMFKISTKEAGECEELIRLIHATYTQYSYAQVLNACCEMCSRHIDPSRVTLKCLSLNMSKYIEQFEEIIEEMVLDEQQFT